MDNKLLSEMKNLLDDSSKAKENIIDTSKKLDEEYKQKKDTLLKNLGIIEGRIDTLNYLIGFCDKDKSVDEMNSDKQ